MAAIFEEFANGEDYNASDFNTYSMRQSIIACDNQTDRDSIPTPQAGMMVYRKDLKQFQIYDGTAWFSRAGVNPVAAKVKKSAVQSIPHNTETMVTWNSEEYDHNGFHDNVTNNSRLTVPEAGSYRISGYASFSTIVTYSFIRFAKNGTALALGSAVASATGDGEVFFSFEETCIAGDYFEMLVFQTASGATAKNLTTKSYFAIEKL